MPNPNFKFPGITLTQRFEEVRNPATPTLGAVIIGPAYRLHRSDVASERAKIADQYTGALLTAPIPGASTAKGEIIDSNPSSHRLVVKNGIFSYANETVTFALEHGLGKITATKNIAAGDGKTPAEETFGIRGAKVGDPIIVTQGETRVAATIVGFVKDAEGNCKTAVLSNCEGLSAEGAAIKADFCYRKDVTFEQSEDTFSLDISAMTVTVKASLTTDLSQDIEREGTTGTLKGGDLYVEYRERDLRYVGLRGSAATVADAEAVAGPAHVDNPLGLALYSAIMSAGGNFVYFTATKDDTPKAFVDAADSLGKYTDTYSIVPATMDREVIGQLAEYTTSISENKLSKIRRALFYAIAEDRELTLFSGTATVGNQESVGGKTLYPVTLRDNVFATYPLQDGDVLEVKGERLAIVSTNLFNTAYVTKSVSITSTDLVKVIRTYPTSAQYTADIISRVASSSYRCQAIWADGVVMSGQEVENYVVAAAVAGMRSAEVAWRPLSRLTFSHFGILGRCGLTYSQLEELGANGVWVVENNDAGVPCNMMATTNAASGDVNKDNQSIISSMDSIAMEIVHTGEDLIGCSNVSDSLVSLLRDEITLRLDEKTRNAPSVAIGPQIISYEMQDVYMDNAGHVYAKYQLTPPKPFNTLEMTMIAK